ncbi:RrnaAD, ribosomal rRNA adenine dimethylase [Anopheles darlingi]|uniref:Dimethyladenosine transferase 2, mitochondrial n=1 Tax=Anopheles darlingi TaxID=43151 RepID=W5JWF5_ANODA|nr:RrnaAD, ribosomal rRNA adenine dimethylase [Anopheles darlingi]
MIAVIAMNSHGIFCRLLCSTVFGRRLATHRSLATKVLKENAKTTRTKKPRTADTTASTTVADPVTVPKDVQDYFQARDASVLSLFPPNLLRKCSQNTERFYIADRSASQQVADVLTRDLPADRLLVEVNPGPGLLTSELLKKHKQNLRVYETESCFESRLKTLGLPDDAFRKADFNGVWRLAYLDSFDGGQRAANLLNDLPHKRRWQDEVNFRLFSVIGSIKFLRYLMNSITYQNEFYSLGRYEMILVMSPLLFSHIASTKESGYKLYRGGTIVFQTYFEHELIGTIPRRHLVPWFHGSNTKKLRTLHQKLLQDGTDEWYLVKIMPRKNLYEYLPPDNLALFASFVTQHFVSRKNRIIPTLEHWIPNSGARLIMNSNYAKSQEKDKKPPVTLPSQLVKSVPLAANDYLEKMTIYTEFGELTPSQVLTLFNEFINWSEFHQSPFVQAVESQKPKQRSLRRLVEEEDTLVDAPDDVMATPIPKVRMRKS